MHMSERTRQWLLLAAISGAILGGDQLAKWLTVTRLDLGEVWHIFPDNGLIQVMHSLNTGAAFGIFPQGGPVFLVVALITSGAFIYLYPRLPEAAWVSRIGVALVLGGALSNAIDRIRFGHVIDYFYVQLGPQYANISNFADHAITLGVALLLIDQWIQEQRDARAAADSPIDSPTSDDGQPLAITENTGQEESHAG